MKRNSLVPFSAEPVRCGSCGGGPVSTELVVDQFQYGNGASAVALTATVPLRTCSACGFQFTDTYAELARHEAVCRHLGVMTPREVLGVRQRLGLSRAALAEATGIGEASLARWESGVLIQNKANDQLMFLMTYPENVERLKARRAMGETPPMKTAFKGTFRALRDVDRRRGEAARFRLRTLSAVS